LNVYAYSLAGLRVSSELEIPDLPTRADVDAAPDVRIRVGPVPDHLKGASPHPVFEATANQYLLRGVKVARYLVRGGDEILIAPSRDADPRAVRVFLLGPCLRALCHQRGLLPLRASAVALNGKAVAFAGPSMCGKSTLAAHLKKLGFPVLADDVCIVGFDAQGRPAVMPSVPRLRLWRGALASLGTKPNRRPPDRAGIPRFSIPFPAARKSVPLSRVYVLDQRPDPRARVTRIPTLGAARTLTIFGSLRALTDPMGSDAASFALVLRMLAGGVEVFGYPRRGKPETTARRLAGTLKRLAR
jgi:energy-coupling factor transporter ATP-binding protein EcfA2